LLLGAADIILPYGPLRLAVLNIDIIRRTGRNDEGEAENGNAYRHRSTAFYH